MHYTTRYTVHVVQHTVQRTATTHYTLYKTITHYRTRYNYSMQTQIQRATSYTAQNNKLYKMILLYWTQFQSIVLITYLRHSLATFNSRTAKVTVRRELKHASLSTMKPFLPVHLMGIEVGGLSGSKVVPVIQPTIHVKVVKRVIV